MIFYYLKHSTRLSQNCNFHVVRNKDVIGKMLHSSHFDIYRFNKIILYSQLHTSIIPTRGEPRSGPPVEAVMQKSSKKFPIRL